MADEQKRQKLKRAIAELASHRGRHTELVSVYVPAGYDLNKIIGHLQQEQGTAENIKSASTRKNVISALERMIQHLKLFTKTPENGIVAFSGNVAEREGQLDVRVWSLEPPIPLNIRIYRCDKEFVLDPLKEMLEAKDVYALVVMDRREGDIALLKGKRIIPLISTQSHVPGKFKAGGQCVAEDTLIQLSDGDIIKIKDSHNPLVLKSADFNKMTVINSKITDKWETAKQAMRIVTKYPRFDITCSSDHSFFVMTRNGLKEVPAEALNSSSVLLFPEKIDVSGKIQKIAKNYELDRRTKQSKIVTIPKTITCELAQLAGYFLGDGYAENDRINFYEQHKDVAEKYSALLQKKFNVKPVVKFKQKKGYYEIRAYGRQMVNLIRGEFFANKTTLNSTIPKRILASKNDVLASFLRGFFDAEGYVSRNRVGLGINNRLLAKQVQLSLLRFGVISSLQEYDNRMNPYSSKIRYTVDISEKESLGRFMADIGFSSEKKGKKLKDALSKAPLKNNVRRILMPGSRIREMIESSGMNMQRFPKVTNFFRNERMMSKDVFKKSILGHVKDKNLKQNLAEILNYSLLPVRINKIESLNKKIPMVDISVANENFLANGLVVHNSAHRFEQNRELSAKDFYRKIAEYMKEKLLPMGKELKGILVGGPGPTKHDFIEQIMTDLKNKIIAVKDLSYTGEFGLHELVEKSADVLAQEDVSREKKVVQKFLELLATKPAIVAYGKADVEKKLEIGAVDTILLSEALEDKLSQELEEKAEKSGAELQIISVETREGIQLRDMGGIAAILRYEVH